MGGHCVAPPNTHTHHLWHKQVNNNNIALRTSRNYSADYLTYGSQCLDLLYLIPWVPYNRKYANTVIFSKRSFRVTNNWSSCSILQIPDTGAT